MLKCLDNCFSRGKLHLLHVAHLAGRALTHIAGASPSTQQCRQTIVTFLSQAMIEKDMFSKERPSPTSLFWWKCIEKSWVRSFFSIEFRLFSLQGLLGASQELPQFHWYAEQCLSPDDRVTNTQALPTKVFQVLVPLVPLVPLVTLVRLWIRSRGQSLWLASFPASWGAWICCQAWHVQGFNIFDGEMKHIHFQFTKCRSRIYVFFKYFWLGVESVEFYCNCMMASLLQGQSLHFWHLSSLYHDALAARLGIWWVGGFPCPSQQVNNWGLKPLLLSLD